MSQLRIQVGASLDASASTVYTPLVKAAERARKQIAKELNASTAGLAAEFKAAAAELLKIGIAAKTSSTGVKAVADAMKEIESSTASATTNASRRLTALAVNAEQAQTRIRRSATPGTSGIARSNGWDVRWGSGRIGFGYRSSIGVGNRLAYAYGAGGALGGAALAVPGMAGRYAMQAARMAGVEADIGHHVASSINLESEATKLSNSAYMPGDPRNGGRVDPAELIAQARSTANATGSDAGDTLGGLRQFVGKTGDLATGREILADMARLSKATGTNMSDMIEASADVSMALGDIPDKGKAIKSIMATVAGQGKLGAIEIKDMASQMAKLASMASMFEGTREHNIGTMGALAQAARQYGGAATAQNATTAAAAFARDLTVGANLKHFSKAGVQVWADKGHTKLNDPEEIIAQALAVSGGSLDKLRALFPNANSMKVVRGFASIYNDAGGGDAGMKAFRSQFSHLRDTSMGGGEIQESFNAAMKTSETQIQLVNNQLAALGDIVKDSLLPAIVDAAPPLIEIGTKAARLLGFITGADEAAMDKKADKALANATRDLNMFAKNAVPTDATTGMLPPEMQMDLIAKNQAAAAPFLNLSREDEDEIQKAIDLQEKRVAYAATKANRFDESTTGKNDYSQLPRETVVGLAQGGSTEAKDYIAQTQRLALLQEAQSQLHAKNQETIAGILKGGIRIINLDEIKKGEAGAPGADQSGRMPPASK